MSSRSFGAATVVVGVGASLVLAGCGSSDDLRPHRAVAVVCEAPGGPPGSVVRVVEADLGMSSMMRRDEIRHGVLALDGADRTVVAGRVSLAVANLGWATHELVVLPLGDDARAGQRPSTGPGRSMRREASARVGPCAEGAGDGLLAGTAGWVTLKLSPGRYELLCNLPGHYEAGMFAELVVV